MPKSKSKRILTFEDVFNFSKRGRNFIRNGDASSLVKRNNNPNHAEAKDLFEAIVALEQDSLVRGRLRRKLEARKNNQQ